MKLPTRQSSLHGMPGVIGTVRMDRRVGTVLRKAQPGDVAVIDHLDLDRATAEALIEQGVGAVVNASPFISGRYPNLGPELLVKSGVTLVEAVDEDLFSRLRDGGKVRVLDGTVYDGDEELVAGRELSLEDVQQRMDEAREGLTSQLQTLTHNTTEFLRREPDLLLHGQGIPDLRTQMQGRPVVVVVRDFDHETDLRRLRQFINEQRPVLVGVDAGADALLGARLTPDVVIVGDDGFPRPGAVQARAVSDKALTSAREVVLHSEVEGRAVGFERLDRLGVRFHRFAAGGSTEDVALL